MKKSFYFLCTLALTGTLFSCNPTENEPAETDYTKYVNTFIGAADNGHTFPGACRPFGMIQTSPVTGAVGWRYCSEYVNSDSIIWGFTQTHLNGTGCMDLGDVLVMPVTGTRTRAWDAYRSRFSKKQEAATPGCLEWQDLWGIMPFPTCVCVTGFTDLTAVSDRWSRGSVRSMEDICPSSWGWYIR